jgi:hypothetical protein
MDELRRLIGVEHGLDEVSGALRDEVQRTAALVVGALEVNCADESELECVAAFQRHFVEHLLPDLKTAARAPFRICNLGARYEEGAVGLAEQHYALPVSARSFKVLVVKVNAHVAVSEGPGGMRFGGMRRYETDSAACGALHALLRGDELPALAELRRTFAADGHDRIAALLDPRRVAPAFRYLCAAVVNARLQAGRAVADIRKHKSHTPTLYLVVPCVTLNRSGPDTELVVGYGWVDCRKAEAPVKYEGLGDDPARYRVGAQGGRLEVTEE